MTEKTKPPGTLTVAIIKPDAVKDGQVGKILDLAWTCWGLVPWGMKMEWLPADAWKRFYAEHKGKPFFDELIEFMSSGPSVFIVFKGENAVASWRQLMGATDPRKAQPNTIRRLFGTGGPRNAVHGSDSDEAVVKEIAFLTRVVQLVSGPCISPNAEDGVDGWVPGWSQRKRDGS
jgi:nucleoside-diphosphate kinase